jgi:hypothetical protein
MDRLHHAVDQSHAALHSFQQGQRRYSNQVNPDTMSYEVLISLLLYIYRFAYLAKTFTLYINVILYICLCLRLLL